MARAGGAYEVGADGTLRRVGGTDPGNGARDAAGRLLDGPPEATPARRPRPQRARRTAPEAAPALEPAPAPAAAAEQEA